MSFGYRGAMRSEAIKWRIEDLDREFGYRSDRLEREIEFLSKQMERQFEYLAGRLEREFALTRELVRHERSSD
jgi:hypothetical protein